MANFKQTIQNRWKLIVTLSIVFVVALITQDIVREVILFRSEVALFKDELNRDVRDDVFNLVNSVAVEYENKIENQEELAYEHAQENLEPLLFAANTIHDIHDLTIKYTA